MTLLKNQLKSNGVRVKLLVEPNIVIETLERLGITDNKLKIIYPSCYLYKDKNVFKIMHFKEMILEDGLLTNINETDYQRRDSIIHLLEKWNLVKTEDELIKETVFINIVKFKDIKTWKVCHKYKRVTRQIFTN